MAPLSAVHGADQRRGLIRLQAAVRRPTADGARSSCVDAMEPRKHRDVYMLRQTNFEGSKLLDAGFFDADLSGADISDANLRNVNFSLEHVTKILLMFHCKMSSKTTSANILTGGMERVKRLYGSRASKAPSCSTPASSKQTSQTAY